MKTVHHAFTVALVAALGCSSSNGKDAPAIVATGLEREGNDTLLTANDAALAKEGWLAARIDRPGDADLYRLVIAPGAEQVLVAATFDPGRAACLGIDTVLELLDAAGQTVVSDDDGGLALCARLERALTPGTWYLRVAAFDPGDAFPYALRIELGAPGIEREPNDSPADALAFAALAPGGFLRGTVDRPGDVDTYRLDLPGGGVAQAQLLDKAGGACGPGAPGLTLESPPGHVLASTTGCAAAGVLVEAGTAYVTVRSDTAPVEYGLRVTARSFDEREPNGTMAEANAWAAVAVPAADGVTRSALGRITPGDGDVYQVVVPAGPAAQLLASVAPSLGGSGGTCAIDAVLELFDAGFYWIASNRAVAGAGCSTLTRLLPPGTYYLRVTGGAPALDFAYLLTASAAPVQVTEVEPNGTQGQARQVRPSGDDTGTIAPLGDVDFWKVTAAPRSSIYAYTSDAGPGGGCHVDTVIEVLDATGAVLAQQDGPGPWWTCAAAGLWTEQGGTFYVRVSAGAGAAEPFAYRVGANAYQPIPAEHEPNGTFGTAGLLEEPHLSPSGLVSPAGDVDYWRVVVPAGAPATLWADTQDGTFGDCTAADTVLALVDAGGAVLASADDVSGSRCARLTALLDPGTYALRVSAGAGAATFPYDLYARLVPFTATEVEPNGTQAEATLLAEHAPDGVAVGAISPGGDVDVWRFVATAPGLMSVKLRSTDGLQTGACTAVAPRVRILDAGGAELAASGPSSYCGEVWFSAPASGPYDVELSSADPAARWAYSLNVTAY